MFQKCRTFSPDSFTNEPDGGMVENNKIKFNIEDIKPKLKTNPNGAFFWSGRTDGVGGAEIAEKLRDPETELPWRLYLKIKRFNYQNGISMIQIR